MVTLVLALCIFPSITKGRFSSSSLRPIAGLDLEVRAADGGEKSILRWSAREDLFSDSVGVFMPLKLLRVAGLDRKLGYESVELPTVETQLSKELRYFNTADEDSC
jgi:hypothetical protein